ATSEEEESFQLYDLATSILEEYKAAASLSTLDTAIYLFREALDRRPTPHPMRSNSLKDVAGALVTRFSLTNQSQDLDQGIQILEAVITLHREALLRRPSPHPNRVVSLDGLSAALYALFRRTDDIPCLDEAISLLQEAVEACPESNGYRSNLLSNLSATLATRFGMTGQLLDLQEAVARHRDVHQLVYTNDGEEASQLLSFASELFEQVQQSYQITDLETSISLFREGLVLLPVQHPNRLLALNNLANALLARFEQLGEHNDLDSAISFHQEVLELRAAPHPDRSSSLYNLADALSTRFDQSGQREDLESAISFHREALELFPAPHPHRSSSLNNFANALMTRFDQSGQPEDLNSAISFHREALKLRAAPHPDRSRSLDNLANALRTRFDQSGQLEDLDSAISFHQEALELFPAPHPRRSSSLNNLAIALNTRFDQSGQREDLDSSISFHREALELFPAPHPHRSGSLDNLANALRTRFDQSGQREDLDSAISFHREALELRAAPHPHRSSSLNNLAGVLKTRFNQSGQREDLDKAINMFYEALDELVSGHPDICTCSSNLGQTLMNAYSTTNESLYLDEAMAAFQMAVMCETGPASLCFRVAKTWARHADSRHKSALDAYQAAINLLPRLAMLGLNLQSRQQALTSGTDGLARNAAACAIRSGQYDKAIELLEEGRAIFWSQALRLRTPMMDLRGVAPILEDKLIRISLALEQGSLRDASRHLSDSPQKVMSMEKEASHFRCLNDEWLATVELVRHLDGFQDFMRPSRLSTLQDAVVNGPVVILNASKAGCAALVLTLNGVQHVPIPDLSSHQVTTLVELIRNAIAQGGRDTSLSDSNCAHVQGLVEQMPLISDTLQLLRLPLERHIRQASDISTQPDDIFRYVLGILWTSVVEPVIRLLKLEKCDFPPRIWWCPTGPFAFLPIHASGIYLAEGADTISDYVVSSYTPTISSLLGDTPLATNSFKMLAVVQPDTPGQKSLPCTLNELQKIESHVPNNNLVKLAGGSVKEVISHLPEVSIAHFACHGEQNIQNPLESALLLQDGPLKVSHIMQKPMPNASLAFLSACETAMDGVLIVFRSIADVDGPKVADSFYETLFKEHGSLTADGSGPDITQAARALHLAVAKLRSENASFVRWVPFIHLGR
ncbi:hypothetical protein PILCRDRAFT_70495, partial [Piloderma croceum F 1598]